MEMSGMTKPELPKLPKMEDRMTFLYLEHCILSCEDSAITAKSAKETTYVPAGAISVLLLGPGTDITHKAMELIGDSGIGVCWVGEKGVRYYAGGRPLTTSSRLLIRQAELVSNQRLHLDVVRKMYVMRFPGEDVSKLTLQQLRGREGSRIRKVYREQSVQWHIAWNGRDYDPDHLENGDPINRALSSANVCLYGLAQSVICALGASPALGFVHIGHERSFVYDIADLYKTETTIPASFEMASKLGDSPELSGAVRRRVRDIMTEHHILERMVKDIKDLLLTDMDPDEDIQDTLCLWDGKAGTVPYGVSYGKEEGTST